MAHERRTPATRTTRPSFTCGLPVQARAWLPVRRSAPRFCEVSAQLSAVACTIASRTSAGTCSWTWGRAAGAVARARVTSGNGSPPRSSPTTAAATHGRLPASGTRSPDSGGSRAAAFGRDRSSLTLRRTPHEGEAIYDTRRRSTEPCERSHLRASADIALSSAPTGALAPLRSERRSRVPTSPAALIGNHRPAPSRQPPCRLHERDIPLPPRRHRGRAPHHCARPAGPGGQSVRSSGRTVW